MTISKKALLTAHKHASNNEDEIGASEECACFHCLETFPKEEIEDWVEGETGNTAVCPRCDVESVLGDAAGFPLTEEFLDAMRQQYFG